MLKVKTLIDTASKVCGSQSALSNRLGIQKSQMSEMRTGSRSIAPEVAILIADVAGANVTDAALAAIIENSDGTPRGEQIKAIIGKALLREMLSIPPNSNSHTV